MRITTLVCICSILLLVSDAANAFDAAAPDASGGPSGASTAEMKPNAAAPPPAPPGASEPDAGARSAKSIECSQKADAKDLHGKPRKHFMHECKRGEGGA